ncbi:hypothetical protein Acr_00g0038460 [Actinidia rufa]|uniref:Uncharacterized protein n=1 Tax=Actinidia rufa TaxID=165716 RepID=A0A7J0DHA4_9ERIC|nr:hypothetical protein Acr_00g0038460 [Actinidia rufa]
MKANTTILPHYGPNTAVESIIDSEVRIPPHLSALEARNPFQNGGFKSVENLVTSWKIDTTSKDTTEALFVEEEKVQYHDDNVEKYCNVVPVFDKPTSNEIEGPSEEDEALALVVLTTYLTPKQDGEKVIEEDDFIEVKVKESLQVLLNCRRFKPFKASLGYGIEANQLLSMVDSSWYIVEECLVTYSDDILFSKRHAYWEAHSHMNKIVVDASVLKMVTS